MTSGFEVHPFGPLYDENSEILILGSFPSRKSREQMFFYGHPQNRFWPLIAALFNEPAPLSIEDKRAFALRHRIAIWDVAASCEIEGSGDSTIRNVVPTDLRPVLAQSRIRRIFCNGGTSAAIYRKYHEPVLGIKALTLPSTSPANAAWTMDRLISKWKTIADELGPGPYYKAYDERYRAIHDLGLQWAGDAPTPIVSDVSDRFCPDPGARILEIGCGEGRDAAPLLAQGRKLLATDASAEAISYCRKNMPQYAGSFAALDCLRDALDEEFDMIYAVAVVHMLVEDGDRRGFYRFIRGHLKENGVALICSMGDGETEMRSDASRAFDTVERRHPTGPVMVAATSCRMISFEGFRREIAAEGLDIIEEGITSAMPDFDSLMYAVVRRSAGFQTSRE